MGYRRKPAAEALATVIAINRLAGMVVLNDGRTCGVDLWLDCDGDETDDSGEAVVAVVQIGEAHWEVLDLAEFAPPILN